MIVVLLVVLAAAPARAQAPTTPEEAWSYLLQLDLIDRAGFESFACGTAYATRIVECGFAAGPIEDAAAGLEAFLATEGVEIVGRSERRHDVTGTVTHQISWSLPTAMLTAQLEGRPGEADVWVTVRLELDEAAYDPCVAWRDVAPRELVASLRGAGSRNYESIRACVDLAALRIDGVGPLLHALEEGYIDPVIVLARDGIGLDDRTEEGLTPLMLASATGRTFLVVELVGAGAEIDEAVDLDARDEKGRSAVWHAVSVGRMEALQTLLQQGAKPSLPDARGVTPLMLAGASDAPREIVEALLRAGASIDERTEDGRTPLMLAARHAQRSETIHDLLDLGADLQARDDEGWTAVMWAAMCTSSVEVLEALIDRGASLASSDGDVTAAELLLEDNATGLIFEAGLTKVLLDALVPEVAPSEPVSRGDVSVVQGREPYIESPRSPLEPRGERIEAQLVMLLDMRGEAPGELITDEARVAGTVVMESLSLPVETTHGTFVITVQEVTDVRMAGTILGEDVADVLDAPSLGFDHTVTVQRVRPDGTVDEVLFLNPERDVDAPAAVNSDLASAWWAAVPNAGAQRLGAGGRAESAIGLDEPGVRGEASSVLAIERVDAGGYGGWMDFRFSVRIEQTNDYDEDLDAEFGITASGPIEGAADGTVRFGGELEIALDMRFDFDGEGLEFAVRGAGPATVAATPVDVARSSLLALGDYDRAVNEYLLGHWR